MRWLLLLTLCACDCGEPAAQDPAPPVEAAPEPEVAEPEPEPVAPEGPALDGPVIAIDTHIDTPQRMLDDGDDPFQRLSGGHVDVPRMREGGLSGAFFSVYVSPPRFDGEAAWERALALTHAIVAFTERHPEGTALCTTAAEVRAASAAGKIAVLMGVEGAHALGTDDPALVMERVRELYRLGNRYMTITWSVDNALGHSSAGSAPEEGLTPLGRRVVREMNRLGMIVDVSHVSDRTFWDIMELTTKPVLASHSSARALSDVPRNMDDAMIRRVAANGGAVCVNFYTQFIDADYRLRRRRVEWRNRDRFTPLEDEITSWVDRGAASFALARELDPELNPPGLSTLVAHFAHVVELGGPTAACLGSDFDGIPELPLGMEDVSDLPALRAALEAEGLPVRAIFGENVLRVLAAQTSEGAGLQPPPPME